MMRGVIPIENSCNISGYENSVIANLGELSGPGQIAQIAFYQVKIWASCRFALSAYQ